MALAANGWPSPSTAWKEVPLVGEPALFEDFADDIVAYQKKDAAENGPLRGFHAKIHAGFIAEFQVLAELPEHARHGVFAAPRTAPIKFGPYAVKFTIRPAQGTTATTDRRLTNDFLREELADRLRKADLVFDFLIQFYVDDVRTPIEDTSVPWRPEDTPLWKVAQLRIPSCDLKDPHTSEQSGKMDKLSFSPWHTTEDHRPLGNVMRARRVAYEASAGLRHHDPEPTSLPL
jgi:hypothetical protein